MCSLSMIKDNEGHKMILNIRCNNYMLERYGLFSFFDLITNIYSITCAIVRRNSSMQKNLTVSDCDRLFSNELLLYTPKKVSLVSLF